MRAPDQILRRTRFDSGRCWRVMLQTCEGAQLVEFALVLPLLVVLVVGITDFGAGFALKDKLTNAGRDGARIAVSKPDDLTNASSTACNGVPCSVQAAATSAVNYLTNAGVSACSLDPSSTSPTSNGPNTFAWTYTSPSNCPGTTSKMSIDIERAVTTPVTVGGTTTTVLMTRVTINYPFRWAFGSVVKLLAPSSNYATQLTLSAVVIMPNLN
jgi:Flp pilus assembly protein TadG